MSGFVVIRREALSHHVVGGPQHFYAWCWLISTACWKPTPFNAAGKTVTLQRGQVCASIRQLAAAWGMSKSAVDRFLTRLETETMIEREAGHGRCIITIRNYDKYQALNKSERDSSGTPTGTAAGQQRDTKEQGNQLVREKEPNGSSLSARDEVELVFDAWDRMVAITGNPRCDKRSPKRRAACRARLRDDGLDAILRAIARIPHSSFLRGETGNWSGATIDFLLRPDTVTSILEGKYDDRPKQPGPSHSQSSDRRDGVAKALDRRLGLGDVAGPTGRRDTGESGDARALPAPILAVVR